MSLSETLGWVRVPCTPGDAATLLPGGTPSHVGLPDMDQVDQASISYPSALGTETLVWVPKPGAQLRPGDVYLFTPADLANSLVPGVSHLKGGIQELIQAADDVALHTALQVLGFIPCAWTVPPRGTTVTTPAPAKPAHARLTFSGDFVDQQGAVVEQWAWSLTFAHVDGLGGTTVEAAQKARGLYEANVKPRSSSQVVLTRTRVALLADGRHVTQLEGGLYDQGDDVTHVPGVIVSDKDHFPLQTALCISFSGARPGPTGKGRCFLPWQSVPLQGNFVLPNTVAQDQAAAVKAIGQGMSGGSGAKLGAHAVISGGGKKHTPSTTPITTYRAGIVLDTMRSRRRAQDEHYVTAP